MARPATGRRANLEEQTLRRIQMLAKVFPIKLEFVEIDHELLVSL
jgi:hypothetical protein